MKSAIRLGCQLGLQNRVNPAFAEELIVEEADEPLSTSGDENG
jgi:hypothetical protein